MKLYLLTTAILLHISLPSTNSQPHVIRKRFLWKSLAQLAQPFIRKPKPPPPPQYNPQSYNSHYATPPVFHVSPSAPQPIRVPPPSGQLYLPLPGQNNYPHNFPQLVQVPPSSYGSSRPVHTQPPSLGTPQPASFGAPQAVFQQTLPAGGAQWSPLATPSEGGTLFHGMGSPVAPPSFSFQTQGSVSDVGNGNLDSLLSGLSFSDLPASLNAATESTKIVTDPPPVELATEGPALFLAEKGTSVPSDFIRVILPDDITRELRKRVTIQTLNDQGILLRQDLTQVYLAPSTSEVDHPPFGLVSVQLSSQALEFLNEYAQIQSAVNHGPQLELPRSVLEKLSKDSSQKVRLINGGRDTLVKTGSADVFIAPSDQKPPDGYVSIPLSDSAMSELKKNFLGTSLDVEKGIPVRAYIAPADRKLPPGHMSIPLPDSILESVAGLGMNLDGRSVTEEPALHKNHASSVLPESDTAIYLAPSRKQAPSSFRKLKLPETIMESLRQAISATRLADSGTPAKDLTAAYLASTNEFVPPGFLSISVPDTLVKMLDVFSETKDTKEVKESDVEKESGKSTDKNKQSVNTDSRDLGVEEGPNLTRKIVDALIEAIKRTVKQVVKNTRDEEKKEKEERRKSSGDANDNDFDDDEEDDENIDLYQPQYQMSPFFPTTISTYPYVDPYQYGGLWTYGDVNQWNVNGNPTYGDYGAVGTAQDRDTYDGSQVGAMPYLLGQQHYDISNLEKRQGEAVSNVEKGHGEAILNVEKSQGETQKESSR
uniref:Uncharacterized protein n=1 Tax=Strigamia maritima TaxID=126957 RepID=T1JGK0_STRMM